MYNIILNGSGYYELREIHATIDSEYENLLRKDQLGRTELLSLIAEETNKMIENGACERNFAEHVPKLRFLQKLMTNIIC